MTNVDRVQFSELNNKQYYFSDGRVSFSYGHPLLTTFRKYKKEIKDTMHRVIKDRKFRMLKIEAKVASSCERVRILRSILLQRFTYYKLDLNKRLPLRQSGKSDFINTKNYIHNFQWM